VDYLSFLNRIIDDGISAAREDYAKKPDKLQGSVEGFEACRGKTPPELAKILEEARRNTSKAHFDHASDYWKIRCFEAEVEWVCNCVSAILMNQNLPTIIPPTARAYIKAAEIVGVKTVGLPN